VEPQPLWTGAYSVVPVSAGLIAAYTAVDRFGEEYRMFRNGKAKGTLEVPRASLPIGKIDGRICPDFDAIDCTIDPWNDEQIPAIDKSVSLLLSDKNHILEAPTGWGKTVVAGMIASKVPTTWLITVTKEDLMDQWYASLTEVLGIPKKMVGRIQQDECNWNGRRFVLGMTQSLAIPDRYEPEMYRYFGGLILDEVHLMAADFFQNVCWNFPAKYRLGLSATPERKDGRTRILRAHIGPTLVRGVLVPMKAKVLVKQTKWRIPTYRSQYSMQETKIPHSPGRMMGVAKAMGGSNPRNAQIVEFVKAAFDSGRKIVVMSDLIEGHLHALFHLISSSGVGGENIGYYIGGMSKIDRDISKTKRVVLATYAMCATGTNVPAWDTLVLATPRADVKQSVGRVLRSVVGKKQPIILDLVDDDKLLHNFHLSRLKQYYGLGAEIVKVGVGL